MFFWQRSDVGVSNIDAERTRFDDGGNPAGDPRQFVSHSPGVSPSGKYRRRSEGTDRAGVRGTGLLEHGDLPASLPDLHITPHSQEPAAIPVWNAGPRARPAPRVRPPGGLVSLAHISGEEASAYYAAGTAQYHINADIMYALRSMSIQPATRNSCSNTARKCWWRLRDCGAAWEFSRREREGNSA